MRIYQVHSGVFGCDVQLTYNHNGILVGYQVTNNEVINIVGGTIRLSINEQEFLEMMKTHNMKVIAVDRVITFDMFWDRYGNKVDKVLALKEWDKLLKDEQLLAFDKIAAYETMLKRSGYNRSKKDPVRYLKHKVFNDYK